MKAVCWNGVNDIRVETVPDPSILNPRDCIVRVTLTAICGSDLHLYHGMVPAMLPGDILGHEFMGEVVEVGPEVRKVKVGDRVAVPFCIGCGHCFFCARDQWALCDNSNPNAHIAETAFGFSASGLFGYSHIYGGYAGGQAQFVRVPFADAGPRKIPDDLSDEQALFLTDILPTGYQAALNCDIKPGDTIAVWGCGPVGLMAIKSCHLLGAGRVIAIDDQPVRLRLAESFGGAETIDFSVEHVYDRLVDMTGGIGPDACIDAVGMEAHGAAIGALYDRLKTSLHMATDRVHALRQTIRACRKGGILSVPGAYAGLADKVPVGPAFAKGLTVRGGQTHVHCYLGDLLARICAGQLNPGDIITHRMTLDDAPRAYEMFARRDACVKIVLNPAA